MTKNVSIFVKQYTMYFLLGMLFAAIMALHVMVNGIHSNYGGIDRDGIYLCNGNYDFDTDTFTQYPLPLLFPSLVTDC